MGLKENGGEVSQQTRYDALRRALDVIASQADLNGVLENLAGFLPAVASFEFLGLEEVRRVLSAGLRIENGNSG